MHVALLLLDMAGSSVRRNNAFAGIFIDELIYRRRRRRWEKGMAAWEGETASCCNWSERAAVIIGKKKGCYIRSAHDRLLTSRGKKGKKKERDG